MPNPFYNPNGYSQQPNLLQMLQQIKSNPVQFLLTNGQNIPQNISNDPNAILAYLLQTRQITQAQVNNAYRLMPNGVRR